MQKGPASIEKLEERVRQLEEQSGAAQREEIRRLWDSVREERSLDKLVRRLRQATRDRTPPRRAQVHGAIDSLIANGDNVLPGTPTIIITSSEPCGIMVVTIITLTVCDTEPDPGPVIGSG